MESAVAEPGPSLGLTPRKELGARVPGAGVEERTDGALQPGPPWRRLCEVPEALLRSPVSLHLQGVSPRAPSPQGGWHRVSGWHRSWPHKPQPLSRSPQRSLKVTCESRGRPGVGGVDRASTGPVSFPSACTSSAQVRALRGQQAPQHLLEGREGMATVPTAAGDRRL